jgi:hypothetical protein
MEKQIPQEMAQNAFPDGDSFMSSSSFDGKKVTTGLRKTSQERLYAHVDRRTDVLWQVCACASLFSLFVAE